MLQLNITIEINTYGAPSILGNKCIYREYFNILSLYLGRKEKWFVEKI